MNINEFAIKVTKKEKGKKQVDIAQTKEIILKIKNILICKTGIDIYKVIKKIK